MKQHFFVLAALCFAACSKEPVLPANIPTDNPALPANSFTTFNIAKGNHYCDKTAVHVFSDSSMSVKVRFDSSCIYKTIDPGNQDDINKLVGFTEGNNNHLHSARFGWRWSDNALRLFAYSYAAGVRSSKEIATLAIGQEAKLRISLLPTEYVFAVDDTVVTLPRALRSGIANGYWQYPYFGGDEVAPHEIIIEIEEI
ncbi:MAG: hypothetical protein EOO02_12290 [Chitinophagaceae bacterium]|nr:MAG: hypothetical protein EOO02_12290 [Chitinophagaceae bacterium]